MMLIKHVNIVAKLNTKIMAIMIRPDDKATKIAYKILGVPVAISQGKSKKQKEIDRKMQYEYTARIR